MRVIAGRLGGRRIAAPPGRDTRPTGERTREALFSSLDPRLPGARVLDLYAGSGALGIEALSRGAASCVFVERDRWAAAVVSRNLADLDLGAESAVHRAPAERFCAAPSGGPFDLVLCDPPYALALVDVLARLADLHAAGALVDGGTVVVERDKRDPALGDPLPGFLASKAARSYGDTVLLILAIARSPAP
jgi:16S rRNA (guanine966-N2)-methyltransferase